MAFTVFSTLSTQLLTPAAAWAGVAGTLSAAVLTPVLVGVSILVFWHGFNILRGAHGAHHLLDVFAKLLRSFLVVSLAIGSGAYASNVIGFFTDLRSGLTGLFISGATINSYAALDTAMENAVGTYDAVWLTASQSINLGIIGTADLTGLFMIFGWGVLVCVLGLFCALCTFNLIFIDFALALMFALGPMFIACMAFNATSRYADGWISGVLKYVLTAVCIAAVVGIGVGIVTQYTLKMKVDPTGLNFIITSLSAICSTLVLGLFVSKMPQVAADMVGGSGLNLLSPKDGFFAAAKLLGVPKSGQDATLGGMEKILERQFGPPAGESGGNGGNGGGFGGGGGGLPGTGNITGGRDSLGAQAATAFPSSPPASSVAAAQAMAAASNPNAGQNVLHAKPSDGSEGSRSAPTYSAAQPSAHAPTASASNGPVTSSPASQVASDQSLASGASSVPATSAIFVTPTPSPSSSSTAASPSPAAPAVAGATPVPTAPAAATPPGAAGSSFATQTHAGSAQFIAAANAVSLGRPVGSIHTPGKS